MPYTSKILIENFLQRDLTEHEQAYLMILIPAVKLWLDRKLDSTFDEVAETTRYYDGGSLGIDIDPVTEISGVKSINDDGSDSYTYTDGTEYLASPQNENVKREIRKRFSPWPRGAHRIAITGKFSEYDNGVPPDIQIAATRLCAGVLNAGIAASTATDVASESLEGHSITYDTSKTNLDGLSIEDPTVKAILDSRKELLVDDYDSRDGQHDDDDFYGVA